MLVTPAFPFASSKPSPGRLSQTAQAALSVLKSAPGPERVTHNPCFVVVTEGWGKATVGVSWPRRPAVEGNRRLTYCCGLLPGLGSGPGACLGPLLHVLRGTPPCVGQTHGQGRGRKIPPTNPAPRCPGDPQGGQHSPPTRPRTAALQAQEPQVAPMGREGPWSRGFCASLVTVGFIRQLGWATVPSCLVKLQPRCCCEGVCGYD